MIDGKFRNSLIVLIACLFVSLLVTSYVYGESEEFTVPPHNEVVRTVGLSEGEKVSGSIDTYPPLGIDFYVTDPNGETILRKDKATKTNFSFTASTTGTYTMHFSNTFSLATLVKLNYSVTHPTPPPPDSPQEKPESPYLLVIAVLIGAVIVLSVLLFVTRRKPLIDN